MLSYVITVSLSATSKQLKCFESMYNKYQHQERVHGNYEPGSDKNSLKFCLPLDHNRPFECECWSERFADRRNSKGAYLKISNQL